MINLFLMAATLVIVTPKADHGAGALRHFSLTNVTFHRML
jgi:hypothetical protein